MFKQIVKSVLGVRSATKADLFIYLSIYLFIHFYYYYYFFFVCLFYFSI